MHWSGIPGNLQRNPEYLFVRTMVSGTYIYIYVVIYYHGCIVMVTQVWTIVEMCAITTGTAAPSGEQAESI